MGFSLAWLSDLYMAASAAGELPTNLLSHTPFQQVCARVSPKLMKAVCDSDFLRLLRLALPHTRGPNITSSYQFEAVVQLGFQP